MHSKIKYHEKLCNYNNSFNRKSEPWPVQRLLFFAASSGAYFINISALKTTAKKLFPILIKDLRRDALMACGG